MRFGWGDDHLAHRRQCAAGGRGLPVTFRKEIIGNATLYLARCEDVLPILDRPAALIGDPPYGQRQNTNIVGANAKRVYRCGAIGGGQRVLEENRRNRNGVLRGTGRITVFPDGITGDDTPFDPSPWLDAADRVLLWGAHKFADRLPIGSWLVWDKVPTGKIRDQGDGEIAWVNDSPPRVLRIHRLLWDGVCVGSAARNEVSPGQQRVHPAQKPVVLMEWCIRQTRVAAGGSIFDPWMGSGSTGVAAVHLDHPFIGVECEPVYFETAFRRIEAAQRQRDLFVEAPPAADPHESRVADLFTELQK